MTNLYIKIFVASIFISASKINSLSLLFAQCPALTPTCYNSIDCNGLSDKDNDGVPDVFDLDDDNDGILDSLEGRYTVLIEDFENPDNPNVANGYNNFSAAYPTGSSQMANSSGTSGFFRDPPTLTGQIFAFQGTSFSGLHSKGKFDQEVVRVNLQSGEEFIAGTTFDFSFYAYQMNLGSIGQGVFNNPGFFYIFGIRVGTANPTTGQQSDANVIEAVSGIDLLGVSDLVDNTNFWELYTIPMSPNFDYDRILIVPTSQIIAGTGTTEDSFLGIDFLNYPLSINTDKDELDDYLDLDSDNDGIPDAIEACGNINLNLENCSLDSDGNENYNLSADGCSNGTIAESGCFPLNDTDNDNIPDFRDLDSDGDGCADAVETGNDYFYGVNLLSFEQPATLTQNCGLVIFNQNSVCEIPENNNWINASLINLSNPNSDCDGDGIVNILDCDPLDSTNVEINHNSSCNKILIFDF